MHRIDKSAGSHPDSSRGIQVAALQDLLSDQEIELVCHHLGHTWRDRIFTPAVTVRSMVHRVLNPDKSIRAVLVDLAVVDDRLERTPAAASWCEARSRLPEALWPELLQHSVKRLEQQTSGQFLHKHRPVFLIDGSTLSMPDTPALAEHFGYSGSRHGPSRFPLGRITFVVLAGSNCVWDYRFANYRTSEDAQLHQMWDRLPGNAICVFDRQFSSFYNLAKLLQRGIDSISRLHHHRDPYKLVSQGTSIGDNQWIVWLDLTPHRRKKYGDPSLPQRLCVRLIRLELPRKGKPKQVWLVTTLLDNRCHGGQEIEELYRARWAVETRIGELKTTLEMNVLRSKSAHAVCYDVAATILAYNLLRIVIHQAAKQDDAPPDRISFASAVKMVLAYSLPLRLARSRQRQQMYARMLSDIARCRNPVRPGRVEPRRVKRLGKQYPWLRIPRALAREQCLS
jgi:hypothetical protein